MVFIPRIVTVDPTGIVARVVRAALELLDLSVIQTDIPFPSDALNEIGDRINLVVTSHTLDSALNGFELAHRIQKSSPNTSVIVLADNDERLSDDVLLDPAYVCLARPLDTQRFLQVLVAGLESPEAMQKAYQSGDGANALHGNNDDLGVVPKLDSNAARKILEKLQSELGSMAIMLADRVGNLLLEVGTTNYFNREELTRSLVPMMKTNLGMREIVGGQVTTIQFYDGDNYDVFVLSVGLHHFISVVFEGEQGARQFGFVNRFGRKAVEDLIGLIGASAFFVIAPTPSATRDDLPKRQTMTTKAVTAVEEPVELARADIQFDDDTGTFETFVPNLEPITELNLDLLFGDGLEVDESIFDFDNLDGSGKEDANFFKKGKISWDDAKDLGVLKD